MESEKRFSMEDVKAMLQSVDYSIKKIEEYRYADEKQRRYSLQPLLDARDKLRIIRDELKGKQ